MLLSMLRVIPMCYTEKTAAIGHCDWRDEAQFLSRRLYRLNKGLREMKERASFEYSRSGLINSRNSSRNACSVMKCSIRWVQGPQALGFLQLCRVYSRCIKRQFIPVTALAVATFFNPLIVPHMDTLHWGTI